MSNIAVGELRTSIVFEESIALNKLIALILIKVGDSLLLTLMNPLIAILFIFIFYRKKREFCILPEKLDSEPRILQIKHFKT